MPYSNETSEAIAARGDLRRIPTLLLMVLRIGFGPIYKLGFRFYGWKS